MKTRFYPALIHKSGDFSWGISFYDLPGCISAGRTLEECLLNGQEALNAHLEVMHAHGDPIPEPTSDVWEVHHKLADEDKEELEYIQMVSASMPGKAIRLNISMDEALVQRIDAVAGAHGRSRFLAEAAKLKLANST